jgi:threonine/homoserine/homoserine lactone efflux protein
MSITTLLFIHFLACLTPGIALVYALDVLTKTNLKNATKVIFGIALGNALEIILSVMGISLLANIGQKYPTILYSVCACLLFYLGGKSLAGFFSKTKATKQINSNKYILTGFTITMCNPKALLFWPFVLYPVVVNYSVIGKVLTAMYFIVSTFLFVFLDVYLVSIFKKKMLQGLKYMQDFFGAVMVGFGILMIWKVMF